VKLQGEENECRALMIVEDRGWGRTHTDERESRKCCGRMNKM